MNWLDILIVIFIVVSVIGGLMAGIVKILITIIGLILGVVLAGNYGGSLADKLTFISDARTANIVAFVLIMIVVMISRRHYGFRGKKARGKDTAGLGKSSGRRGAGFVPGDDICGGYTDDVR